MSPVTQAARPRREQGTVPWGEPRALLERVVRRGRRRRMADAVLAGVGIGALAAGATMTVVGERSSLVAFVVALLAAAAGGLLWRRRAAAFDLETVTARIDTAIPAVEHGTELLAVPARELGAVARLQRARTAQALAEHARRAVTEPMPSLRRGIIVLVAGVVVGAALFAWAPRRSPLGALVARGPAEDATTMPAVPVIERLVLHIEPPAYTGRPRREIVAHRTEAQHPDADIAVAEGARVTWRLDTAGPPAEAELLLDDRVVAFEQSTANDWVAVATVGASQVFRARLLDAAGDEVATTAYGRVTVLADRPPRVSVEEPPLLTQVDGQALDLAVRAVVSDDYGVTDTALVATLALGAGEMVQFREQRMPLHAARADAPDPALPAGAERIGRRLDLATLGLEPGGELYFFVEAWDNRPGDAQRSRSATHVVRWPGASASSVSLSTGLPMILPPETFRSQRQIIIDTERLLAERPRLDEATFAVRSRIIAQDQHALRLRYGSMLGDEFIDGRAVGPGDAAGPSEGAGKAHHDDAPGSPQDDHPDDHGHAAENGGLAFGGEDSATTTRLIDLVGELEGDLVHAHDSEESATFFTTETKRVLKSSLANMWEAELRLNLADPEEALPYEYRALRLLKEVQQASRVYVRRVGFDTPPLDPARRLTGELDDIESRSPRHAVDAETDQPAVRAALRALTGGSGGASAVLADLLAAAMAEGARGSGAPDSLAPEGGPPGGGPPGERRSDLVILDALRAAVTALRAGQTLDPGTRRRIEAGLWRRLRVPERLPDRPRAPNEPLAAAYRAALGAEQGSDQ